MLLYTFIVPWEGFRMRSRRKFVWTEGSSGRFSTRRGRESWEVGKVGGADCPVGTIKRQVHARAQTETEQFKRFGG